MNIGIVLHRTPAYSETFFLHKIKFLKEAGHQVILFVEHNDGFSLCKVKTGFNMNTGYLDLSFRIFRSAIQILLHLPQAAELLKLNKMDGFSTKSNVISLINSAHIIGHKLHWIHFGFAETAILKENVAKSIGAKLAVSVRGYDLALYPLSRPGCYQLLWNKIDKLHHISDHLLTLAQDLGFNAAVKKTMKITPAVDPALFSNQTPQKSVVPLWMTTARLHWIKGLDDTLIALSLLNDLHFEYHIFGDGPEKERLRFLIKDLNLVQKVILRGRQSPEVIRMQLAKSDLYIQYSEHEGFCNALLEAQASGILCVAANNSALKENIIDGETGFLAKSRNPDALASVIRSIYVMDHSNKDKIRHAAQLRIQEEFNLNQQREKFLEFYQN